jgi:hypothetical protein
VLVRELDTRCDPPECRITLSDGAFLCCTVNELREAPEAEVSPLQLRLALDIWRAAVKSGSITPSPRPTADPAP